MDWVWVVGATWLGLAVVLALIVGGAIRRANELERERPRPGLEHLAEPRGRLTASSAPTRWPPPPVG